MCTFKKMKNKIKLYSQHATQLATPAILHSHMGQRLKSKILILHGWNLNFFFTGG